MTLASRRRVAANGTIERVGRLLAGAVGGDGGRRRASSTLGVRGQARDPVRGMVRLAAQVPGRSPKAHESTGRGSRVRATASACIERQPPPAYRACLRAWFALLIFPTPRPRPRYTPRDEDLPESAPGIQAFKPFSFRRYQVGMGPLVPRQGRSAPTGQTSLATDTRALFFLFFVVSLVHHAEPRASPRHGDRRESRPRSPRARSPARALCRDGNRCIF